MSSKERNQSLPATFRNFPPDLAALLLFQLLTLITIFTPVIRETPLRVIFGLPFVLFVPGYALIAALFPEATSTEDSREATEADSSQTSSNIETIAAVVHAQRSGIDGIERIALSFGTSIAIVPLIGLVLNFTPWGIRLVPIVVALASVTTGLTVAAVRRRWALPPEYRFQVPYREWIAAVREELLHPDDRADFALNVLLVLSILLAVGSVGYAVAVPKQGESFTELYLLTETSDGELVADNYPTDFQAGQSKPVIVGVGNHEHEQVEYHLIVVLQRVQQQNNSTTVLAQQRLGTRSTTIGHNETWRTPYSITPGMTGNRLRLAFLLFRGTVPSTPTVDTAYREVHLWISVSE